MRARAEQMPARPGMSPALTQWGGRAEDRLKAELRANVRATRSEYHVDAAGGRQMGRLHRPILADECKGRWRLPVDGGNLRERGLPSPLALEHADGKSLRFLAAHGGWGHRDRYRYRDFIPIAIWMRPSRILNGECKRRRVPFGVPRLRGGTSGQKTA